MLASNAMSKYYPDYKGRDEESEEHFELWLHSKKFQHYAESWYRRVLETLRNDIQYELGLSQFQSVKMKSKIELIAPDAFRLHIPVLEKIVRDLRIIHYSSDTQQLLMGAKTEVAWKLVNNKILIYFPKSSDRNNYLLFHFRKGISKNVLLHALNEPDHTARRSDFSSSGQSSITTSRNFADIFRRLLERLEGTFVPQDLIFERIYPSSLSLNMKPLVLPSGMAKKITTQLKPSSKPS